MTGLTIACLLIGADTSSATGPSADPLVMIADLGEGSFAEGVSNERFVVGYADDSSRRWGYIYDLETDTLTVLPNRGEIEHHQADAINESGQVAITSADGSALTLDVYDLHADTWTPLGADGGYYQLRDINEDGVVVGWGNGSAVVWEPPLYEPEPIPGTDTAWAVNDSDIVVGNAGSTAFVHDLTTDETTYLDSGGASFMVAYDINNEGMVVGWRRAGPADREHGFAFDLNTGEYTDLGEGHVEAINDDGVIVGAAAPGSVAYAHHLASDQWVSLGTLLPPFGPDDWSVAADINDHGDVVGRSRTDTHHSFITRVRFRPAAPERVDLDGCEVARVGWGPVFDGYAGAITYDLLRDGVTIGSTADLVLEDPSTFEGAEYRVRATNAEGTSDLSPPVIWRSAVAAFSDVDAAHPFCEAIGWALREGITVGFPDGTFRPTHDISRMAVAAFLYRQADEPAFVPPTTPTFEDVPVSHPFYAEIEWAASEGIATGFADGGFHPSATITRMALAAFLYRAAGSPPYIPPTSPSFNDVPVSHPFFLEIEWVNSAGIAAGYLDGGFHPRAPATRQAVVALLYRFDRR